MSNNYPCCSHCENDPTHNVEKNRHEGPCDWCEREESA